jgi:hypothetical protein
MERPTLSQTKLVTKVVFTPEKFSEIEPYQSLWFVLCGAHSGGTPECPVLVMTSALLMQVPRAGPAGPLGMTRKEDSSRLLRHSQWQIGPLSHWLLPAGA